MVKYDSNYKKCVGQRIRSLRKAKNLTQLKFSDMLGISPQAVSRWELGDALPYPSKLPQIARILGVGTDELLKEN